MVAAEGRGRCIRAGKAAPVVMVACVCGTALEASQNERAFVLNGLNASRNLTTNHFLSNVT